MLVTICSRNFRCTKYYAYSMVQQPSVDQGFFIIEISQSHSDTLHSVGLLWTSDQLDAETFTWQHVTITRDRYAHPWWDLNLPASKLAATDPRKRKSGHRDRLLNKIYLYADKWPFSYIELCCSFLGSILQYAKYCGMNILKYKLHRDWVTYVVPVIMNPCTCCIIRIQGNNKS
jgi:hypothetical protein